MRFEDHDARAQAARAAERLHRAMFDQTFQIGDDHLLSDVVMPGGSAMTIVASVRQRYPSARLLFMSGYPADGAVGRGVVTGEANFLQKPFTPDGLALRVRALLDQPQGPTGGA